MFLGIYGQAFDPIDAVTYVDFSSFEYTGQLVVTCGHPRLSTRELKKILPELTVLASTTVVASLIDLFFIVIRLT